MPAAGIATIAGGTFLVENPGRPAPPAAGAAGASETSAAALGWLLVYERDVGGEMALFLIPAAGGIERRLTHEKTYDGLARFTADGRKIVFTSSRSGPPQIWEMDADGTHQRPLRVNAATEYQSDVSPDGTQLAFLSNLNGPERLMVQDLRSAALREVVRHGKRTIFGNPHWSPDGRRITFSSNWRIGHQIYVVDVASGKQQRLSPITSGGCEPRFSRDGRKVVYVSRGHMRPTSSLVEHDLASGQEKTLVAWPALNYDPVYSPDGTELAFASNIAGQFAIYRQRLADGRSWRVSFAAGDARNPDYGPAAGSSGSRAHP